MANGQLERLLARMPDIAKVVNGFASPAIQAEVLWILVMASDVDLDFGDWEHPALRWNASESRLLRPWVGLDDLLSNARLSEAYARLTEAELRAEEESFVETALEESLDAEGLRVLAARAADGVPVRLRNS